MVAGAVGLGGVAVEVVAGVGRDLAVGRPEEVGLGGVGGEAVGEVPGLMNSGSRLVASWATLILPIASRPWAAQ
jgi:hypothetical protein